jgi:hypothetical protein
VADTYWYLSVDPELMLERKLSVATPRQFSQSKAFSCIVPGSANTEFVSPTMADLQIAATLNQAQLRSAKGKLFTKSTFRLLTRCCIVFIVRIGADQLFLHLASARGKLGLDVGERKPQDPRQTNKGEKERLKAYRGREIETEQLTTENGSRAHRMPMA